MGGGRQAWCPRCDEVRGARAGAACPVCGRQLLAMPAARPGQPRLGPADRVARRLRALAPAAGAVGVALLVLAVVASAFAAGRLTRTTPSAPESAPTTTVAGFADEGSETGRRTFDNWQARASGMTVELRGIIVGTGFTRLELHVEGVPRGREVSAIERLRVRDRAGNDLLGGGQVASIATATSRPATDGGIDTEVVLDRPLDQQAVAGVELGGLTIGRAVAERLTASLVDPELQRRTMDSPEDQAWLRQRTSCPGCRLRVACQQCHTLAVTGSEYRRGRVVVAVEAVGPVAQSVLNPSRRRVVVTDQDGLSELPAWIDGSGGSAAITVGADLVTVFRPDQPDDRQPMGFNLTLQALAEQVVRGRWAIRQAGG
jgi:hypothetical protein